MQVSMIRNIMIRNVMSLIISILLLLLISYPANAGFYIGTSYIYANINDKNYNFVDEFETNRLPFNLGYSKSFKNNIVISAQTNRILNSENRRSVVDRKTGILLFNKSKLTADNLSIGYRIKRIIPTFVVSNLESSKKLYYKDYIVGSKINHSIVYGLNINYIFTKNINTSIVYIAPNKKLNLEGAFGIGINYLF